MFIWRARTRTTESGKDYFPYRLVRSECHGDKARQRTLFNLGSKFPVDREHWRIPCTRVAQLVSRQGARCRSTARRRLHTRRNALPRSLSAEDNVTWLRDNGYRFLVVSRERIPRFDHDVATAIETGSRREVRLQSVMDEDGMELRLDCYSNARKKTEGRHHRALRGMFRGRTAEAARRAVASPHPLWRRRCPAADRPEPREEPWHRAALHGRCHHRSGQGRRTPMRENAAGAWDEEIDCGGWHLEEFER